MSSANQEFGIWNDKDWENIKICQFCELPFSADSIEQHENICTFSTDPNAWADTTFYQDWKEKFEHLSTVIKKVKKFGLTGVKVTFKLKPVPTEEDSQSWFRDGVQDIVTHAVKDCAPTDQIGICIGNKQMDQPAWCAFKQANQVDIENLIKCLESVIQSNQLIHHDQEFILEITKVKTVQGSGRTKLRVNDFNKECLIRKGIVTISNQDNLCLPRALVVAKAAATNNRQYGDIRKNKNNIQTILTNKLLEKSRVIIPPTGATLNEVQRFQNYYSGKYLISVYNYNDKSLLFRGDNANAPLKLNLIYHDGHFNVIKSLTAAFACSYYCDSCCVGYSENKRHRCEQKCSSCLKTPPCVFESEHRCSSCRRSFKSKDCFDKHISSGSKTKSVCEQIKVCPDCFVIVDVQKRKNEHKCGEIFCKICLKFEMANHVCYMQVDTQKPKNKGVLFVFFDLETMQDKEYIDVKEGCKEHEANLCVSQQVCLKCIDTTNIERICSNCGIRQHVFYGKECIDKFLSYVFLERKSIKNIICISHNGQAFDSQFVLKYMVETKGITPEVIMKGSKVILIQYKNIKFIDSLNYLPMALSKLPSTFNLKNLKKGYFPYFFNTEQNQNYIGPMPDLKYYGGDGMSKTEITALTKWYNEQKDKNVVFDMSKEIIEYAINDVRILRETCIFFRAEFLRHCGVCPFSEGAVSIASAVNMCYRRKFLQPNTIQIVPEGGYRMADQQSFKAINWLLSVEKTRKIKILHAGNGREYKLPETNIKVDGYSEETKEVFQFHGCYFHGCLCIKFNRDKPLYEGNSITLNLRYESTRNKSQTIKSLGYKLTEMWECQFDNYLRENKEIRDWLNIQPIMKHAPLKLRDALYGGRTGNTKLYYKTQVDEKIRYYDVCSLYPWVCKYGIFPIHEPSIHIGHDKCTQHIQSVGSLNQVYGLIKCKILPPRSLYHPVLPLRQNGKLFFTLCAACSEMCNLSECSHNDDDRCLYGTWVTIEVSKAIEKGYEIIEMFEMYSWKTIQYDRRTQTRGLFTDFINTFLKIKQEASGFPVGCTDEIEKRKYIQNYFDVEGILLDYDKIQKNPGLRSVGKLILNSFWGKHAQRLNQPKTSIIKEPRDLLNMFIDPAISINYIQCVNDDIIYVNWEFRHEQESVFKLGNIVIAAFVTAQARLKLYSYLERLDDRVLYYDTDSIIYITKEGEMDIETGDYLGDMTDELEEYGPGSYITEFLSSGPKSYAYKIYSPHNHSYNTVCKVKGLTLNYQNSKKLNFEKLKEILLYNRDEVVILKNSSIKRSRSHTVYSEETSKRFKVNFEKRRLVQRYDSFPYGY